MGLMLQAAVAPLGQRIEHQRRLDASEQLRQIHQHLKAYWVNHARLPCPVVGSVSVSSTSACTRASGGVPVNVLGMIGPIDSSGALVDPWSRPLTYHVSMADVNAADAPNSPDWLTAQSISTINFTKLQADLQVCREALQGRCQGVAESAADIVAVVVSHGAKDYDRERDNRNHDRKFISAPISTADEYAFDDQLTWLGRSELIYLALQAGWLP